MASAGTSAQTARIDWVAVKELKLSYHNMGRVSYHGNLV